MIHVHIDVDNLWMYEQEFGIHIHQDREYIYTQSLPTFLKLLHQTKSKATFMIIGKDLILPACKAFCKKAIALGHEIANHTWDHPIAFSKLSHKQKALQITKTHKKILEVCGKAPVGFRGAGYYQDKNIINILEKYHYLYDSSVLPGLAHVMMSSYARIQGGENKYKTFGRLDYLFKPDHPFILKSKNNLLEFPISVLPIVLLPMHTTFAYFFGSFYRQLILQYLKSKPSYVLFLFHAIDFIDLPVQKNHPVIPLRYSFQERMKFAQQVLEALVQANSGPLKTSREKIAAML